MLRGRTPLAAACILCIALAQSCSSDYSDDQSFVWGVLQSQSGGLPEGWVGDGMNGWQQDPGAYQGTYFNSFSSPCDVCITNNGIVYAADTQNHRVCRWDASGIANGWIGGGQSGWQQTSGTVPSGTDVTYFYEPSGVSVDSQGSIYVADKRNNRVCRWTGSGSFDGWIGGGEPGWQWGQAPGYGDSPAHFSWPVGIWIQGSFLYVADSNNHRVTRWDLDGTPNGWIGGGTDGWRSDWGTTNYSPDPRCFYFPMDVCVAPSGYIYVADMANNRISRWDDSTGDSCGWIGNGAGAWLLTGESASPYSMLGYFNMPTGVLATGEAVLVSDSDNNRICSITLAGASTGWIGGGSPGWKKYDGANGTSEMSGFSTPGGICLSRSQRLYVADKNNHRVSRWSMVPLSVTDTVPPGPVTNFSAAPGGSSQIDLGWNASGDDGMTGQASGYIIRYSTSAITSDYDFFAATDCPNNMHPNSPGSPENLALDGFMSGPQYWFAIKVVDEFFNMSMMAVVGPVTIPS